MEHFTKVLDYSKEAVRSALGNPAQLPYYQQAGTPSKVDVPYLEAIIVFMTLCFLLEFTLDWRQYARLKLDKPPETLTRVVGEIDAAEKKDGDKEGMLSAVLSKFESSRAYNLDKASFGFIESAFSQLEATAMVLLGFLPFLWDQSVSLAGRVGLGGNEIVVALVFMGLNMAYENVVHMPFSLYSTFVIEQRHGFNKQTLGLFILDKIKAIILTALLGGPLMAALIWLVKWGGPRFYIYVWALIFVFALLMLTLYPTLIAPLFNKYEPLEDGKLRQAIETLASKVSFPLTKIFIVDGSRRSAHSNAYFYGMFKNKRIVLYDTLIKQVNESELVAILGHELGHWKRAHTIQMFLVSQVHIFMAFYVFGYSLHNGSLYASFGFATRPTLIGLFLFFQTIWAPIDKVLSFAQNVWSRHNEYQADEFAVGLGYGGPLQSGLVKLQLENLGNMNPDPWYSTYHHSHPVLVERLTAIRHKRKHD